MSDQNKSALPSETDDGVAIETTQPPGPVSAWLRSQGFDHEVLAADHLGIEMLAVEAPVTMFLVY